LTLVFHKVILQKDRYLAMLTFEDARKLMMTSRLMYQVFNSAKGLKKVVRYGNLNVGIRAKYWREISDQLNIARQVR